MMLQEYFRRKARRERTTQRAKDKSKPLKRAPKHNDRKDTVTMSGEQILEDANPYKEKELRRCLPADVFVNTSLNSIRSRGLTIQDKEHAEALVIDAEAKRKSKLRRANYIEIPLEQYLVEAQKLTTDYDKVWQNRDYFNDLAKVNKLMKMSYWQKVKLEDCFYEDIERVFPVFWKLHREELVRTKKRQTKGAMLKPTGDHKTSLSDFCQLVIAISKGKKENILSTPTRKRELERAGITEDLILMEFVKFEDSETLKAENQSESEKYTAVKSIIEANGNEVGSQFKARAPISFQIRTISYSHPSVDSDNEELIN